MGDDHFRNLQPGTIVNGRYEVVKSLGAGSMGMVYACRDRELGGRLVAMKVLFSEVAADKVATARFKNEIFASYAVNHPNVVRAYEYFVDRDLIAYTMEYVGGGDLAERIGGDEKIPIPDIVKMLTQMCCGVLAIHKEGIIHRDLKPENILITSQGDIKITDFGIARCGSGPKLTEHGGVVGTIDYVSPEYLELGHVDARSDIYAVGVLGFEMITGKAPFSGQSVIETMTMRLRTDPRPPAELRQDCPGRLSDIILHAMKRNPAERYQTAEEIIIDLDELSKSNYSRQGGADFNRSTNMQRPSVPVRPSMSEPSYGAPQGGTSGMASPPASMQGGSTGAYGAGYRTYQQGYSGPSGPAPVAQRPSPSGYPAPSYAGGGGGLEVASDGQSGQVNPFNRSAPSPNYGYRDDYYVTEDEDPAAEDRRFKLYSQAPSHSAKEVDLGRMARSQPGPQTLRPNSLVPTGDDDDEREPEVESRFLASAFFWISIVILGFGLGCAGVYAYNYAQRTGSFGLKVSTPPPPVSQPYRQ